MSPSALSTQPASPLLQLIYASAATQPFPPEALRQLLTRARARNATYGVTGLLLYHSGSFLQVLEGPLPAVDTILASINRDPRHRDSRTLSRSLIAQREFPAWSMGFTDTSNLTHRPPGQLDYHRDLPTVSNAPTKARQYLRFFQEGLYRQSPA